jgi:hypothetical protein
VASAWRATASQRLDDHLQVSWLSWGGDLLPNTRRRAEREEAAAKRKAAKDASDAAKKQKQELERAARAERATRAAAMKKPSQVSLGRSDASGDVQMSDVDSLASRASGKRRRADTVTTPKPSQKKSPFVLAVSYTHLFVSS